MDMDKETKNALAVGALINEVKKARAFKGVLLSFSPYICYHHHRTEDRERLPVTIETEGYGYGTVSIEEGNSIMADTHHLQFTTKWQDYTYNSATKTFEITGSSEKMGDYRVSFLLDGNI